MSFDVREPYSLLIKYCDKTCDYKFWQGKAEVEGFPKWFFDLLQPPAIEGYRKISPAYRYLELIARRLFPDETLAVYEKGELYGMYESFYGMWLAVYRRIRPAIRFFHSHLDITGDNLFYIPENLTLIKPPPEGIKFLSEVLDEEISYEEEIATNKLSVEELLNLVSEGDGKALEIVLKKDTLYFPILIAAAKAGSMIFATRLPVPELNDKEKKQLLLASLSGGDYPTLKYYQKRLNKKVFDYTIPVWVLRGIQKSLLYRANILSIYKIIALLPDSCMKHLAKHSFGLTSELALLILDKDNSLSNYRNIIYNNLGNLELLLTILPLYKEKKLKKTLETQENYFPLGWNNL